ncbi:MAG: DMT family transporter [Crocinitomicaceae bacterium]
MNPSVLRAHIALFSVNAFYGANHLIAKGVMPLYLTPNVFIAIRVSAATLLFWIVKSLRVKEKIARKDLFLCAICGVFGVANNQLFFFHGLNLSSSINAGIIMTLNPIMVAILAYFVLKEAITPMKALGILLGAVGAILLTLRAGTGEGDSILGDLFLFINALSYGIYLVLVKPLMQRYSPLTVLTYVFSFGTIYVLLFPPTIRDLLVTDFSIIPAAIWWKIAYVILCVTFLAYFLTVSALKHLSASVSSSYIYFQPVMVIIFAYLFSAIGFSEDYTGAITLEKIMYMLIIFCGVYITSAGSLKLKKKRKTEF